MHEPIVDILESLFAKLTTNVRAEHEHDVPEHVAAVPVFVPPDVLYPVAQVPAQTLPVVGAAAELCEYEHCDHRAYNVGLASVLSQTCALVPLAL